MQYNNETIAKLVKIAEEKGKYDAVASYLGIHPTTLKVRRRECPILDKALSDALKKHVANSRLAVDYKFSKEELEDITAIVRESNIDIASKKYGLASTAFFKMRQNNPELDAAITKGQKERKSNTPYRKAMEFFKSFDKAKLEEATKIAKQGGLEALEKEYGYSSYVMIKCRKELPELELAISNGLRAKPIGMAIKVAKDKAAKINSNKEPKKSSYYRKRGEPKKPPKEIINITLSGIADQTETALANFKKQMEERKKIEHLKKVHNGDYDNMI